MKIKKELIKREIAGDTILVPVGKTMYDSNGMFVMNELASFIWDQIPVASSKEDILKNILKEYDINQETARADLVEFMDKLHDMDIL